MLFRKIAIPAIVGATLSFNALGQGYPDKAVRVVVPFPAGGAGGSIGANNVARSVPDGYTLLFASSSVLSINPHLGAKAPYDILRSFTPIALIGHAPNVLVVHPSVPATSVRQLIALARSKPDALAYASNGTGTLSHLTGELFSERAGIKMLHVPYKGAAPAVIDTMAGNVSVLFAAFPSVSAQVNTGRLRALAVTSARRIAIAPKLPTVAETLPGFESSQWWGLYGPAGLASAIVGKLNAATNKVLATEDIKKSLVVYGAAPSGGTPAELVAYHKADYEKWGKVIAKTRIK